MCAEECSTGTGTGRDELWEGGFGTADVGFEGTMGAAVAAGGSPIPGVRRAGRVGVIASFWGMGRGRLGTVGPSDETDCRASNGIGGGVLEDPAAAPEVACGAEPILPRRAGAGVAVLASEPTGVAGVAGPRARSASSTTWKNDASSSMSPSASQGPPARDSRSERVALRSTIHFCSVLRSRNRWTFPSSVLSVHSGTSGSAGLGLSPGGAKVACCSGEVERRVTTNRWPQVVH